MFPDSPPPAGSPSIQLDQADGTVHTWRTESEGHWIVDVDPGVQVEIRRLPDSSEWNYSFLRTNGRSDYRATFNEWQDLNRYL